MQDICSGDRAGRLGIVLISGLITLLNLQAQDADTVDIDLRVELLQEVTVLEFKEEKPLPAAANSYALEEKLDQLSQLQLVARGAYAREPIFRGQAAKRTQVLIDGMRVYQACTDRMDPATSYVSENNLSDAVLHSSSDGGEQSGMAAGLDLRTRKAKLSSDPSWDWGLEQKLHTNGLGLQSSAQLQRSGPKWGLRLTGNWQKRASYRDGRSRKVSFSQYQKQNWSLSSTHRLGTDRLLQAQVIYDRATNLGYPSLPMDVGKARSVMGNLRYRSRNAVGPFQSWKLMVYHNHIYHAMDDTKRPDVPMHMDMPGWSRTSGFRGSLENWNWKDLEIAVSGEGYTNYRRAEMTMYPEGEPSMFMLTWPDARLYGAGLSAEAHWSKGPWQLSGNLRGSTESSRVTDPGGQRQWQALGYEVQSRRAYLVPQWGGQIDYQWNNAQVLSLAASYGKRMPGNSELYGYYLFHASDGFDYLGKPDLNPEALTSLELSYRYEWEKATTQFTAHTMQYVDYIFGSFRSGDPITTNARGLRQYVNIPQARFYGLSAEFRGELPLANWRSNAQLEYNYGELPGGNPAPMMPPLQGSLQLLWEKDTWQASSQLRWTASQKRVHPEVGVLPTPGWAVWDMRVAYRMKGDKVDWTVALAAQNLLDHYYRRHLSINQIAARGRNIVLELRLRKS